MIPKRRYCESSQNKPSQTEGYLYWKSMINYFIKSCTQQH